VNHREWLVEQSVQLSGGPVAEHRALARPFERCPQLGFPHNAAGHRHVDAAVLADPLAGSQPVLDEAPRKPGIQPLIQGNNPLLSAQDRVDVPLRFRRHELERAPSRQPAEIFFAAVDIAPVPPQPE